MRATWLVGMIVLYLTVQLVAVILDNAYMGAEDPDLMASVISMPWLDAPGTEAGGFIAEAWENVEFIGKVLFFNYSFLTGSWVILKYFAWALSIATAVMLYIVLKPSWL